MGTNNNGIGGEAGDGLPIEGLAELEQDVSPEFMRVIRRKIYRRTATGQVLAFSWNLPKVILLELLTVIGELLGSRYRARS